MKEKGLRESAVCAICKLPFGHVGLPLFWRVTIERFGVDSEMTMPVMEPVKVAICEACAMDEVLIPILAGME